MTGLPTTQQKRAKHAWDTVTAARGRFGGAAWDEFNGHVKRLGPRIIIAGLGPAVAFIAAKESPDYLLLNQLSAWLLRSADPKDTNRDLQQKIMSGTSDDLRLWTAEALEWLVWVKRFCEAAGKTETAENKPGTIR